MRNAALLLAASALATSACVSLKRSPEARYFVLSAVAEAKSPLPDAASPAAVAPEALLGLLPAQIPEALKRPQLVTAVRPGELRIDPLCRWSEPLDEGVTRTTAENLAALLPGWRVLRSPWPASAPVRARLLLELRTFGPLADGKVRLDGRFLLLDPREERSLARRSFSLERKDAGSDAGTAVQAMSALLGELAGQVAEAAQALPATPAAAGS